MKLTQSNIRSCPQRWRLASVLSCSRAREGVVSRAMSRRVRAILVASMTSAGFGLLLNAAAAEPEGTVWAKYNNTIHSPTNTISTDGRIPLGTSGTGDAGGTLWQAVIVDVTYKMWYGGSGAGNYRIYHATSPDGLTWTKYNNVAPTNSDTTSTDGRIPRGLTGGDVTYAGYSAVIKDGDTYKMWYSGYNGTNYRIYYATSPDGLDWTKYDNSIPAPSDTTSTNGRIPLGTSGRGDDRYVYAPAVIKDGNTYKMWYLGDDGAISRWGYQSDLLRDLARRLDLDQIY
ncbi:MAG: hypothetical protein HYV36_01820 [Lentisphaerae bacterium]|nr:hypothetical protein [Lentisphaerota bacterium]